MTDLTSPVRRRVTRDNVVVTLAPDGLYIREARSRTTFGPISYGRLLLIAARDVADARLAERQKPRRVRRGLL